MPSYMREILSPSFKISKFEPSPPQTTINTNRPFPSNIQISFGRLTPFTWQNTPFSPLPAHFPRPRLHSLFQDLFQNASGPYNSPVSNYGRQPLPRRPSLIQDLFSDTGDIFSNPDSNPNFGRSRPRFPLPFTDISETQSTNPVSNSNNRQPTNQGASNFGPDVDESRLPPRMRSHTSGFPRIFESTPTHSGGQMFGDGSPRMPNSGVFTPPRIPSFPPSIPLGRFPRRFGSF